MTIESSQTKEMYEGNGAAREFPVPFGYSKTDDLRVIVTNAGGVETAITSNFRIVVSENGDTSITYPVSGQPIPSGARLTIYRDTPQAQIVDLVNGGAFNAEVLEKDGFDRSIMMIQEMSEAIDRAIKIPLSSSETTEELLANIFDARDEAVLSAELAKQSEDKAFASEVLSDEARTLACQCADRAEAARDVAIEQTETVNVLMEVELNKINTIIASNKDDQNAAVKKAYKWAEEEPNVPVEIDANGNPLFSAKHFAHQASEISIPAMSATMRGGARVGQGLAITQGDTLGVSLGAGLAIAPDGNIEVSVGAGLLLDPQSRITVPVGTIGEAGIVSVDGVTIAVDEAGVLSTKDVVSTADYETDNAAKAPFLPKAWGSINGSGVLLESQNVTSVTRYGAGIYDVYSPAITMTCAIVTSPNRSGIAWICQEQPPVRTVGKCRLAIGTFAGGNADDGCSFIIF